MKRRYIVVMTVRVGVEVDDSQEEAQSAFSLACAATCAVLGDNVYATTIDQKLISETEVEFEENEDFDIWTETLV